ncbi:glycoside hydrolase family 43 protein [Nonomuraea sp. NPDC049419]|uniref:glycoside hydrolase family 43 protein n=1 Tax=Nonomuraea sp. NPDC049419 TaxID=3155772 RepID=UPI0034330516
MPAFRNPVLPGCHPDPSICRVGADFYLVTSSFAYFPGLPVFHSRDLVRWRQLGHVVDRPGLLPLEGLDVSDGLWAPTIRHHEGRFYVVSTLAVERRGHLTFVATADDPAGPWSDPVPLEAEGIDPSLFFDDDGRCWFTACRDAAGDVGPGELWMRELDLQRLKLVGPTHVLWHGAVRGAWVEAPHLYKRDGTYHLIAAEGGTERNHSVTAARSETVTGPYVTDPRSPLLTHRHRDPGEPVHNVGHADLVDTPDGETWAVTLGVRPIDGTHTLGRETFLVPVTWTPAGPVFAPESGGVRLDERLPSIAAALPEDEPPAGREHFDGPVLGPEWNSLRGPVDHLTGGGLEIEAGPEPLSALGVPAFVGRRQQHVRFRARTSLTFAGARPGAEAGLAVFQNQDQHATLALIDGEAVLTVRESGVPTRLAAAPVHGEEVVLEVEGDETGYTFRAGSATTWATLGTVERAVLSTERAGGFVGVYLGLYASGGGRARFGWFDYEPA